MKNSRIMLVDDNADTLLVTKMALTNAGHQVVLEARTSEDAVMYITGGKLTEHSVEVVVQDALMEDASALNTTVPLDGMKVSDAVQRSGSSAKVVAFTSLPEKHTPYGDFMPIKIRHLSHYWRQLTLSKLTFQNTLNWNVFYFVF